MSPRFCSDGVAQGASAGCVQGENILEPRTSENKEKCERDRETVIPRPSMKAIPIYTALQAIV
jgi:hypothetical protein